MEFEDVFTCGGAGGGEVKDEGARIQNFRGNKTERMDRRSVYCTQRSMAGFREGLGRAECSIDLNIEI